MDVLLEENGQDILKFSEEGIYVTEGSVVKGRVYGVAPISDMPGSGYGLWVTARLVRETGLEYDEEHLYSLEDLTDFLAKCKELYPDRYPLGQITSGKNASTFVMFGGRMNQSGGTSDFGIVTQEGQIITTIILVW